jgi:hypothetical protein
MRPRYLRSEAVASASGLIDAKAEETNGHSPLFTGARAVDSSHASHMAKDNTSPLLRKIRD